MSVFDRIEARLIGTMPHRDSRKRSLVFLEDQLIRPETPPMSSLYALELKLGVTFDVYPGEMQRSRKYAEQALADALYGDVLGELSHIMHAISDGERDGALDRCEALMAKLRR